MGVSQLWAAGLEQEDPPQGEGSCFLAQGCLRSPWPVPAVEGWMGLKVGMQG